MNLKRLRWGAGVLGAGIVTLLACDGSNLFDPNQNPFIEPRVSVTAPNGAFAGDTMVVAVSASAAQNVATITVAVRGAATKDTTLTVTPARTVNTSLKVGLPAVLTDTLIYVSAIATDQAGNVSKVKADTVSVVGPPSIISVTSADSLKVGTTANIRIHAFGSRKISELDLAIRGAITKDTSIFVVPTANDVTQSVAITLPATVGDTALRVGVTAKDVTGLSSTPASVTLPLAISPPVASVSNLSSSVAPGGAITVTVRGQAMRGVSKVGVVLSGAMTKDTSFTVDPAQADVSRDFQISVPGDIQGTQINLAAYAVDKAGLRSVPSAQTAISINNGLPVISSVTAVDSTRAGQIVDVRVVAQGVRPITQLDVHFRGAANSDQKVVISPAKTSVTADLQIQLPVDVSDTILRITAVATDQAGQLSALTAASTKNVKVTDVTAPTVTATPNTAATSAGSAIQIRIQARDNVALKQVGYAVVNPAGDTIGTSPTLATTAGAVKDTTFSFTVPLTLTPRTVRVLGIAVDASGHRGFSTAANVIVADSAAPTITVLAPAANSTLPLNDSVRVQLHIVDPTGIKTVTLRGESTRVDSLGPTLTIQRFAQKTITFSSPLPRDTIITRYLNAIPDSISEPVSLIFTASDSLNNTATTTSSILVGGPRVELRNPINNASVTPGGTLLLTAFAVDRSSGIDSVAINITGAQTQSYKFLPGCLAATCKPNGLSSSDSVLINQNYLVGAPLGTLTVMATAWNKNRIAGVSSPVTVTVSATAIADTAKPQVKVVMTANDRVELSDTISLDVSAQDVGSNGLGRIGVVIKATPSTLTGFPALPPRFLYLDSVYAAGRTGLQPASFKFTLKDAGWQTAPGVSNPWDELDLVKLPRGMTIDVHAFALDTGGNCGANVTSTLAALQCDSVQIVPAPTASGKTWWYTAKNTSPLSQLVTVVPGFGAPLPNGSRIADLVVDMNPVRPRVYMANQAFNRIEVMCLAAAECGAAGVPDSGFVAPVSVGSEPWGLVLKNPEATSTRLMVANSGGTNLSSVNISAGINAIAEVPAERILTPNASLFDVTIGTANGLIRYTVQVHDFSDRPQFVAQDANDVFLYSTKPTGAAPDGTVRYLQPTGFVAPLRPYESKILYNRNAVLATTDGIAIAHVDSIVIIRQTTIDDSVAIYDHVNGNPNCVRPTDPACIISRKADIGTAVADMATKGSDIEAFGGQWNLSSVGLSDTTFVTSSKDRQLVGFGEGGTGPYARVWIWRCGPQTASCPVGAVGVAKGSLSDDIAVQDLVGNSAERVLGIALNNDGSVGAARGANSTAFFTNNAAAEGDLRLAGLFSNGVSGGNGGVALHPNHNTPNQCSETTMAYIATVNRSIKIVDTFHFRERGEIQIRDNIVGALRAALPLASENVGLVGTQDEILVKLYGVTGAGRADIINVRRRDLTDMTGCP